MYLNLLHRPKMGNYYEFFKLQQDMAHELGLKATILVSLPAMEQEHMVEDIKRYHEEHGDEIGLFLSELNCEAFREEFHCTMNSIWLYSREKKEKIIRMALERFRECFGRAPVSAAAYFVDASTMEVLTDACPTLEIAVCACFEEGVKNFHGCNNSWYLFNEGGPWSAWYPAKGNTLRPARDQEDAAGIVGVCHLSRDPSLSYESRNDFWASHPANVQRGLGNDGETHPYDFNLVDLYRAQEDLNDGYSYYNVFVGPNWLTHNMNIEDPVEVSQKLYRELLEYLADLRDRGELEDMTMREFGAWYRANRPPGHREVFHAREILYGSGKHYVWYLDPDMRVLIDTNQGGSIGDLRPYAAECDGRTGPDSPALYDGSYPYLIQSQYRSGAANHSFDGTRTTLSVTHDGETADLCACPTKCTGVVQDEDGVHVPLTPAQLRFSDGLTASIETTYHFPGDGRILIERKLTELSDPRAELHICEYFKACYGTTEYPEDLHGVTLAVEGDEAEAIDYAYESRTIATSNATAVRAVIPQINCAVELCPVAGRAESGTAIEGFLFSPYFTLTLETTLKAGGSFTSCLCLSKAE